MDGGGDLIDVLAAGPLGTNGADFNFIVRNGDLMRNTQPGLKTTWSSLIHR